MHFFYIDESGDSDRNLNTPDQPTIVLGGVNLRYEGWKEIFFGFFNGETYFTCIRFIKSVRNTQKGY